MLPSDLEHVLSTWNEQTSGPHPKILYCIPSAGNPTGISWSVARKQIIYKIARQYNVLIVEDDPYYMIQFNKVSVADSNEWMDGRMDGWTDGQIN